MALPNLRNYTNPPGVNFVEGNTTRPYAEDLLEIKGALLDGTKDIKPNVVFAQGGIQLETTGEEPAADETYRGRMRIKPGGAGVGDIVQVCLKKADDTYVWVNIIEMP